MKLSKLMLSAFAAALAMVACNKVDTDPVENTNLKSVKLSLENVIMTKSVAADKIEAGDPVMVENFKIILTDASYSAEYSAKTSDGLTDATFYFDNETFAAGPKEYEFHYVDHKVTKVIAVANMGDVTLQDIKNFSETIANQQDPTALVLFADATLTKTADTHTTQGTDKYTEVYAASVALKPTISRFEVDGFVVNFSTTPKFQKVEVTDIAFDHYYPNVVFSTTDGTFKAVANGTHTKYVTDYESEADVFGWLNNSATTGWYVDRFSGTDIPTMVPDNAATTEVFENRADAPAPLAYHFFAGDVVPTLVIKLLADGNPAYVYTSDFISKQTGKALTGIEGGKIYRMSAAGEVDQTGGSIVIPEDLDPIERCLDITVDVEDWVVELVTPEF